MPSELSPFQALLDERIRRIDVHHHYFTIDLDKEKSSAAVGWKTPEGHLPWSAEVSLRAMQAMNIDFAVLSFPALSSGSVSEQNREKTRRRNEYAAEICRNHPRQFAFLATLPFLDDIEGSLHEISHAIDSLGAYGVSISSCYGEGVTATYIGDERYHPIWAELDRRRAVVFLHGSQVACSTPHPHPFLGIPITEVPNETFKAAAHLVVTGHRRIFPNVKIVLAHLGGNAPFLSVRVALLSNYMGCSLIPDEILDDFKTFYYETALSASEPNLTAVEKFVQEDHILFGTDFPAVSKDVIEWFTHNVEKYYSRDEIKLQGIFRNNAINMFLGRLE